jgi:hypothetical protein
MMLLEMQILDHLPASHDSRSSSRSDAIPLLVKIAMRNLAHILCMRREGDHIVSFAEVIMVGHGICESSHNSLGNV